jgi:hypothetical protein
VQQHLLNELSADSGLKMKGLCIYPGNFGGLANIAETKIGNVTPK